MVVGVKQWSSATKNISAARATTTQHHDAMSIDFPREEERVLARWKEIDAFLRQVELVRAFHDEMVPSHAVHAS